MLYLFVQFSPAPKTPYELRFLSVSFIAVSPAPKIVFGKYYVLNK